LVDGEIDYDEMDYDESKLDGENYSNCSGVWIIIALNNFPITQQSDTYSEEDIEDFNELKNVASEKKVGRPGKLS
jgi:hypothetical protein